MVSATAPLPRAFAHTRRILFEPFELRKWLVLGFAAFLAHLADAGSYQGNPFQGLQQDKGPDWQAVSAWVLEHLPLVITLVGVGFLALLALSVLFLWLGTRGHFVLLDGIVRNRAEIVEPWNRLGPAADRLFRARLWLLLAAFAWMVASPGLGLLIALPDVKARAFGASALTGLIAGVVLLLLGLLALALAGAFLKDFLAPLLYAEDRTAAEAWQLLRDCLVRPHLGPLAAYYLLSLLLGLAGAALMLVACCLTCCLALVPYLSSVVSLPITVFFRCYALEFLAQVDPAWRLLPVDGAVTP